MKSLKKLLAADTSANAACVMFALEFCEYVARLLRYHRFPVLEKFFQLWKHRKASHGKVFAAGIAFNDLGAIENLGAAVGISGISCTVAEISFSSTGKVFQVWKSLESGSG